MTPASALIALFRTTLLACVLFALPTAALRAADQPTVKERASKMILPKLEVNEVSLDEVLDFIRLKSKDVDPDHQGVNIIVKPGGDASAKISLSLKMVPVSEALRYVAELSNHKLTSDQHAFILTPVAKP